MFIRLQSEVKTVRRAAVAGALGLGLVLPFAAAPVAAGNPLPYRYITDSGSSQSAAAQAGYNLFDVGPYKSTIDALPAGTKALVWIGDYDNGSCRFSYSDSYIRSHLSLLKGDKKVAGYYIADEPHHRMCPTAPKQLAARSALVHSLVPGTFTYTVIEDGSSNPGEYAAFRNAADYIGLDPYPCTFADGCVYSKIDDDVRRARAAGVRHIWGVLQAFQDGYYRYPKPTEMTEIISRWRAAGIEGQQTFAWSYAGHSLAQQPQLLAVLRAYNRNG